MTSNGDAPHVHHFVIPAPPEKPLGACRCGETRLHDNIPTLDTINVWRSHQHRPLGVRNRRAQEEALSWRLPEGYTLYDPVK